MPSDLKLERTVRNRLLILVGLAPLVSACSNGVTSLTPGIIDHYRRVQSAQNDYDYLAEIPPRPATVTANDIGNAGVPSSSAPKIFTIAKAVLKPGVVGSPDSEVLAVIHTDVGYAPLHIPAGYTYVWRDKRKPSKTDKFTVWLVPASLLTNQKQFKHGIKEGVAYSNLGTDPSVPHIVQFETKSTDTYGACIDDPACTSGHCGYGVVE